MSHFVKSSKGELMFAALALPRGWKSRLEPEKNSTQPFCLSSRSEWLDNVLNFLMFQKVTLVIEDAGRLGKETSARIAYFDVKIKIILCALLYFCTFCS